jgi:hypothetical protein
MAWSFAARKYAWQDVGFRWASKLVIVVEGVERKDKSKINKKSTNKEGRRSGGGLEIANHRRLV